MFLAVYNNLKLYINVFFIGLKGALYISTKPFMLHCNVSAKHRTLAYQKILYNHTVSCF